jgi:hypothetical protein
VGVDRRGGRRRVQDGLLGAEAAHRRRPAGLAPNQASKILMLEAPVVANAQGKKEESEPRMTRGPTRSGRRVVGLGSGRNAVAWRVKQGRGARGVANKRRDVRGRGGGEPVSRWWGQDVSSLGRGAHYRRTCAAVWLERR